MFVFVGVESKFSWGVGGGWGGGSSRGASSGVVGWGSLTNRSKKHLKIWDG